MHLGVPHSDALRSRLIVKPFQHRIRINKKFRRISTPTEPSGQPIGKLQTENRGIKMGGFLGFKIFTFIRVTLLPHHLLSVIQPSNT